MDLERLREHVKICPKCNGEMESAFILKVFEGFGVKERAHCKRCGFIELYRILWE